MVSWAINLHTFGVQVRVLGFGFAQNGIEGRRISIPGLRIAAVYAQNNLNSLHTAYIVGDIGIILG